MSKYVNVAVNVPESNADELRKAIGDIGAGVRGDYTHCSFSIKVTGRFIPVGDADPTIGEVGKLEEVAEERIEVRCKKEDLEIVVKAIRDNHPYEEVPINAYDLLEI
jgi:hypothetical protein